eukprot:scaffold15662_cov109-Isochrysis_galbana.AAC.9
MRTYLGAAARAGGGAPGRNAVTEHHDHLDLDRLERKANRRGANGANAKNGRLRLDGWSEDWGAELLTAERD